MEHLSLKSNQDLITIFTDFDHPTFNLLIDHLKEIKELQSHWQEFGRWLRLRRIDPEDVSNKFVDLIDGQPSIKNHLIQVITQQIDSETDNQQLSKLLIFPDNYYLQADGAPTTGGRRYHRTPLNDQSEEDSPVRRSGRSSGVQITDQKSTTNEKEDVNMISDGHSSDISERENIRPESTQACTIDHIRDPIPGDNLRLIESTRSNYLPLDDLIEKFSILSSPEIENVWFNLTEDNFISSYLYQEVLNILTKNRQTAILTFLRSIDKDDRCLMRMAELLWDFGINIYHQSDDLSDNMVKNSEITSPNQINHHNHIDQPLPFSVEKTDHIRQLRTSNDLRVNRKPSARTEWSSDSLLAESLRYHRIPSDGAPSADARNLENLNQVRSIFVQHLTERDREMIIDWIGLSKDDNRSFIKLSNDISSVLPDKMHLIRVVDLLKIKYSQAGWLRDSAAFLGIKLGFYQYSMPNLAPISIGID